MSFLDGCGFRHSTTVYASSVLEAAALGVKQLRETELLDDQSAVDVTVEIIARTTHQVPANKLRAWLASAGKDPPEAAMKTKLR